MKFLKGFSVFVNAPSHSRTIAFMIILAILAAIPLTVVISQQQQETRQRAADICADLLQCGNIGAREEGICASPGQTCRNGNAVLECE